MSTTTDTIREGDPVRVGTHPDIAVVESIAPAEKGGPLYAVLYWPTLGTRTSWRVEHLTRAEGEPLPAFSPETVDYAEVAAERAYPRRVVDTATRADITRAVRAAYARGFEDGLRAAEGGAA